MAFDECPPSLADRAYHEASLARTQRWLVRCREAGGGTRRRSARRRARRCSGSRRAGSTPTCARAPSRTRRRSTCRATRSAGTRWVRRPRRCGRRRARRAHSCPAEPALPHGRRDARGPPRRRGARASTCSTACCRRGARGTGSSSRAGASSSSGTPASRMTARRSIRRAPATPAARSHAPTSATCSRPGRSWPLRLNTLHNLHFYLSLMADARGAIEAGRFDSFPDGSGYRRGERTAAVGRSAGWSQPALGWKGVAERRQLTLKVERFSFRYPAETQCTVLHAFLRETASRGQAQSPASSFLPFILIAVVLYFVIIRPSAEAASSTRRCCRG